MSRFVTTPLATVDGVDVWSGHFVSEGVYPAMTQEMYHRLVQAEGYQPATDKQMMFFWAILGVSTRAVILFLGLVQVL